MNLYEKMMTACVMRIKTEEPNGEGGQIQSWTDGESFRAAIVKNSDLAAKIAEKNTSQITYTVTTTRKFSFQEVFKRISDGAVFRVTSNTADSTPPDCASFDFKQVTAERWTET